jgi:glycosyltransferase involved in cell wall biosynthesis
MYRGNRISVVVPAYNEETQISNVIETMPEFIDAIVIIDDCSPDRTFEVVQVHPSTLAGRTHLIRHGNNQGVGGATVTG